MQDRRVAVILGVAALLAVLWASGPARAADATVVASATGNSFTPSSVTVSVGDTVTVTKAAGSALHNVHWLDQANGCPASPTRDAWSCPRTFTTAGTFDAICDAHPQMTLTVTVQAAPTPTPIPIPAPTPTPIPAPTPVPIPAPTRTPEPGPTGTAAPGPATPSPSATATSAQAMTGPTASGAATPVDSAAPASSPPSSTPGGAAKPVSSGATLPVNLPTLSPDSPLAGRESVLPGAALIGLVALVVVAAGWFLARQRRA